MKRRVDPKSASMIPSRTKFKVSPLLYRLGGHFELIYLVFLEKRSTFWVWLQSDLESALKSDLESLKKNLYKKTRWVMFATGLLV